MTATLDGPLLGPGPGGGGDRPANQTKSAKSPTQAAGEDSAITLAGTASVMTCHRQHVSLVQVAVPCHVHCSSRRSAPPARPVTSPRRGSAGGSPSACPAMLEVFGKSSPAVMLAWLAEARRVKEQRLAPRASRRNERLCA